MSESIKCGCELCTNMVAIDTKGRRTAITCERRVYCSDRCANKQYKLDSKAGRCVPYKNRPIAKKVIKNPSNFHFIIAMARVGL